MRFNALFRACMILTVVAFLAGSVRLMQLRLGRGDVYPAYSTLRSDPLGAKVFFQSLSGLNRINASRNVSPLSQPGGAPDETFFLLNLTLRDFHAMPEPEATGLEERLRRGSRLVLTLEPDLEYQESWEERRRNSNPNSPAFIHPSVDLGAHWGVKFTRSARPHREETVAVVDSVWMAGHLPALQAPVAWRDPRGFSDLSDAWSVVYRLDSMPVVIERRVGAGHLILCSGSYPFSNEAVFKNPSPGFLAWVVGGARRVIFDESHLGIVDSPGVAGLIRRFRLQGVLVASLILLVLFIWRNSFPLVDGIDPAANATHRHVAGLGGFEGMVNLLRRSVPLGRLVPTCVEHWRAHHLSVSTEKLAQVDKIMAASQGTRRDALSLFNELLQTINRKDRA
jgi:hypothetical protein